MIGVWSATVDTTAAELPLTTRQADGPQGAIALVAGPAWLADAHAVLEAGAAAVLIAEPAHVDPAEVATLDAEARRRGRAVAVERRRLEPLAAEVVPGAAIVAECTALEDELGEVLRDTVRWVLRLTGATARLVEADSTPRGSLALLDAGGVAATVLVDVLSGVEPGGFLRVAALGVPRVEVVVDLAARSAGVTVGSDRGTEHRAAAFETPRRIALRRLLAALEGGQTTPDLADLGADEALARSIRADHRI